MAAKRRKRKENHMMNNLVIVVAIAAFAVFYYRDQMLGGIVAQQRSPKMALENFVLVFQEVRGVITRADVVHPSGPVNTVKDINPHDGWKGLDSFFPDEDLQWLVDNANKICVGEVLESSGDIEELKQKRPWERYIMARSIILRHFPVGRVKIIQQGAENPREHTVTLTVSIGMDMREVEMIKKGAAWKIRQLFGQRTAWDRRFVSYRDKVPPEWQ